MIYPYGVKVGVELLAHGKVEKALRHLIIPLSYWRTVEFRCVQEAGAFTPTDRILDIGSPKLLSLYLAKKLGADVYATDIEDYFVDEYTRLRTWERMSPSRFHVEVEDGRKLSYADNSFDKVFSVSVMEHIPDNGDAECAREIGRVLAPGGRAMITVPFAPVARDIYKSADKFYWAGSSKSEGDGRVFFQRRYSEDDLHNRLIGPSGLRLRKLQYVGEKVYQDSDREFCEHLPQSAMNALGPIQPLLSRLIHTQPVDSWRSLRKPLCAVVVLEKPAEA